MADKNIQMTQRNAANTGWDNLNPITLAANVKTAGGSDVEIQLADIPKFQTAGGTATSITLTGITLIDGYSKTFIISASNSGSATTINGKSLYKPNTTTAPNLTAGKAVTIWYNLASDCFFIKASAEGNATTGDVLAGKTFSSDADTGLIGTLALTGNAIAADVVSGKTFYSTDAKTKITGTNTNKKWQSGTIQASAWTPTTISGLPFKPSLVVIKYGNLTNTDAYLCCLIGTPLQFGTSSYLTGMRTYTDDGMSFGNNWISSSDTNQQVNNDGFTFTPAIGGSVTYTWEAYI